MTFDQADCTECHRALKMPSVSFQLPTAIFFTVLKSFMFEQVPQFACMDQALYLLYNFSCLLMSIDQNFAFVHKIYL